LPFSIAADVEPHLEQDSAARQPLLVADARRGDAGDQAPHAAAKALLESTRPAMLAGLLYCGANLGAALLRGWCDSRTAGRGASEATLSRAELPWLAGAIAAGGIVGPLLLMRPRPHRGGDGLAVRTRRHPRDRITR
jgi:hypothetical protein